MIRQLIWVIAPLLAACAPVEPADPLPQPVAWKAVLIAGDNREPAFDNAVDAMADKLAGFGVDRADIAVLKASGRDGRMANRANIAGAFAGLTPAATDGCFVFATSHGDPKHGLVLRAEQGFLGPRDLDRLLDGACGARPTVVIASGCFSGVFTRGRAMPAGNRTILSAARSDRPSFGCSAERRYTVFDECVLGSLGRGLTWQAVMDRTRDCVTRSEHAAGVDKPSSPQISVGRAVEQLRVFPE